METCGIPCHGVISQHQLKSSERGTTIYTAFTFKVYPSAILVMPCFGGSPYPEEIDNTPFNDRVTTEHTIDINGSLIKMEAFQFAYFGVQAWNFPQSRGPMANSIGEL